MIAKMVPRGLQPLGATLRKLGSLGLLVIGLEGLLLIRDAAPVYDRPTQSSAISCWTVGLLLSIVHRKFPGLLGCKGQSAYQKSNDHSPLKHADGWEKSRLSSPSFPSGRKELSTRTSLLYAVIATAAICLRVEILRRVLPNRQCTIPGSEGLLLLYLAIWTYLRTHAGDGIRPRSSQPLVVLFNSFRGFVKETWPLLLMASAVASSSQLNSLPKSTLICAASERYTTRLLQSAGVIVDFFLVLVIDALPLLEGPSEPSQKPWRIPCIGVVLMLSSVFLSATGIVTLIKRPEYRSSVFDVEKGYGINLFLQSVIVLVILLCVIRLRRQMAIADLAIVFFSVLAYHNLISFELKLRDYHLPSLPSQTFLTTIGWSIPTIYMLCFKASFATDDYLRRTSRQIPLTKLTLLLLLTVGATFGSLADNGISIHPIDRLILRASQDHKVWLTQANKSRDLTEAVTEYQRRYHRNPPPNFDEWFKFANAKHSIIVDDFDRIHEDLLPFWALEPRVLRIRTREILSDPWNEVAEIRIRAGRAEIVESIWPTHKWMLEGAVTMMNTFAEWLPDMDLAFNVNDEPRIAIPYEEMNIYRNVEQESIGIKRITKAEFSKNALSKWSTKNETAPTREHFLNLAFAPNFREYGSISCPPSSLARTRPTTSPERLCAPCVAPHSTSLFLSNYTLSASPCHQPDLAHLHGLYLSPASFKATQALVPIFSQSKPHGFADILYPSPWNYLDKVKYAPLNSTDDPPLHKKKNSLFWRGATSEGVSKDGTWKGMARQRFVHMASSASSAWTRAVPVLLPSSKRKGEYSYQYLSPKAILAHPSLAPSNLTTDVAFVDRIVRCMDRDCDAQARAFSPLAPPTDFQSHWQHRFLLDLDGAGFSGRFLPFLFSRSLPMKAGIMREWWEGRIAAWTHFVPLDVRGTGLWSTLAYFGGVGGRGEVEAERIAEEGRRWGQRVLRKEDMEVYFFRLLLEWGRLVDDGRGEIGFKG